MPLYEHVFLARQDLAQAQVDALAENATKIITDNKGKVGKTETWGLKSLAYRIAKNRKAHYVMLDVDAPPAAIAELERQSNINEDIIRFLTKGRVAPDLVGVDSAKRPLSLAANKGKVIVLLFWNSTVPDAHRVVEITTAMENKFKGRPFAVIGVNNDPVDKLRVLQADATVPWTNFSDPENHLSKEYRVGTWPLVYVLDGERKIHYAGAPGSFVELTAEALLAEVKPAE